MTTMEGGAGALDTASGDAGADSGLDAWCASDAGLIVGNDAVTGDVE
jgi:hypothetical protein